MKEEATTTPRCSECGETREGGGFRFYRRGGLHVCDVCAPPRLKRRVRAAA